MEPLSLKDEKVIAEQLGRVPRGLLGIEQRCTYGYPQVVRVYPLVEGKPFPTLFWLTCPFLAKQIDHLEAEGSIKYLQALLETDSSLAAAFREAHRTYITERNRLLSPEDRATLEETGMLKDLLEKGIGGTADFVRVKCLHLHVAHALARDNPIGHRVLEVLSERACPPKQVICSAY
jgi:hypothetical protein